ncbi:MAG: PEP-CTERM sorting domain-containing protein, partial [Rhodospirillaceae bacterium]|nr:PEP-CTERM sorting domain-containing protein [Rhodospirillaceae bacterium]
YVFAAGANDATVTGYAGWPCANEPTCGPTTEIPTPATLPVMLFGLGLLGLGALNRRRVKT